MGSRTGRNGVDLWAEIVASEQQQEQPPNGQVIYRRRKPPAKTTPQDVPPSGRTSIAVGACLDHQPQVKQAKRKGRPPIPKGKVVEPPSFEKERAYFDEVDAFELMEESPSPKNYGTWVSANQNDTMEIPHLSSRLQKWLNCRRLNYSCGPASTLSKILGNSAMTLTPIGGDDFNPCLTPEKLSLKVNFPLHCVESTLKSSMVSGNILERDISESHELEDMASEDCEEIEFSVKKLSLASTSSLESHQSNFATLLAVCGQSVPSSFQDVFSKYCDLEKITKVGEGTFGEAFMVGNYVCKIVPIDGDFRVNGEVQKRSGELLEEVVLSRTLNCLRGRGGDGLNLCTAFIDTIDLRVCQGSYDPALIRAWQDWDEKHRSENDHPKEFPDKQCYVVFVLAHGGKDLESFVLLNFNEARTLLLQVTAALAVAEAAYEFEHRDLHWGNVLLSRSDSVTVEFNLEGKKMFVKTFGLLVSIIDFTLSRINTGDDILFLDLSSDPYLFKGPVGDKQSETYRKMKEVTEDCWEESFPRTNVLWLLYLVDILLLKKSFTWFLSTRLVYKAIKATSFLRSPCVTPLFSVGGRGGVWECNSKNKRDMRSLKKRLDEYQSAREAVLDPFFSDLFVDSIVCLSRAWVLGATRPGRLRNNPTGTTPARAGGDVTCCRSGQAGPAADGTCARKGVAGGARTPRALSF
ncbi:hypothetical protein TIFTF001_013304 [Ficus carica]|uniref:non-specific serine/threonine protein kinase n=1 Tax=Ficus carica TaxID=3494 RepID=A0AA88AE27_FICCA|nr:hypothetical protein TIFTF001_013304 [Ficus carica]